MPELSDLEKSIENRRYAKAALAESIDNLEDANRWYDRAHAAYEQAGQLLRRTAVLMVIAGALFISAVALFAAGRVVRARTLHTRRITVGDRTVTLEIPDGQCAEALGVRVCVPVSSAPTSPGKVSP